MGVVPSYTLNPSFTTGPREGKQSIPQWSRPGPMATPFASPQGVFSRTLLAIGPGLNERRERLFFLSSNSGFRLFLLSPRETINIYDSGLQYFN